MTNQELTDEIYQGYWTCVEWLTVDNSDWTLDQMTDDDGNFINGWTEQQWQNGELEWVFDSSAVSEAEDYVKAFVKANADDLRKAIELGRNGGELGHDLFLTRNGHGTGFWDRGLGDVGDRLTKACEHEECYHYLGDDGMIYND